ncbi:hypothetical protein MPTK1_4g20120 [Marchantia polymorpha subsp. ruderalis]|uniref:Uncharacterized protein n=2 Tax=Marchantia polymorpha TaxID=3197 RepID=A0AAF6BBV4_MARPO|nr:hypothetical protein MARPO_0116s0014 [Marchantia polymorpha]BBN09488.1 hypothetical protein Mp_4g20120 [Marchantia polymorpha subsp. ruderalis]|eukprot:PTQ31024.1 hypothetical protein MARPO_0116s0014 [Marchantia polymorpha]
MVGMAPALGVSQMTCSSSRSLASRAAAPCGPSLASRAQWSSPRRTSLRVRASEEVTECNEEECAPTKEVGKLSMSWEAQEKTKVTGTFPPLARQERKWTGYVEKDTAGQTNIYSVEPTMYVADSAISSNSAGTSSEGAENNLAVAGFLSLFAVAGAATVLFSVTKNVPTPPEITVGYTGPALSYYIAKFSPEQPASVPAVIEEAVQAAPELLVDDTSSPSVASEAAAEAAVPVDSSA